MIKNIRHAALVVSNLEKCYEFYGSFFGFKTVSEATETGPFIEKVVGINDVKIKWVKLATPNGVLIELLQYLNPISSPKDHEQTSNQLGHSHLAFTVGSMDQFVSAFKSRGGVLINNPEVNPTRTAKVCYVRDPEGNLLEIVEEL